MQPNRTWFYAIFDGKEWTQKGPVTGDQIQELIQQQIIRPESLLWHESLANWIYAKESDFNISADHFPPPLPNSITAALSDASDIGQINERNKSAEKPFRTSAANSGKSRYFKHTSGRVALVKKGFSWPAFFFMFWWALYKRFYLGAFTLFTASLLIGLLLGFGQRFENEGSSVATILYLVGITVWVKAGFWANDAFADHLKKQNYVEYASADAMNES